MKNLKEFKNLWPLIKEDKSKIILAIIIVIVTSFISISYGYLSGAGIEAVTNKDLTKSLLCFGTLLVIGIFSSAFLMEYGYMLLRKVELNLSKKLSKKIYVKTLDLPAAAHEEKSSGELLNRITDDTEVLSNTFNRVLTTIVNCIGSIFVLIYIFFNSIVIGFEILIIMLLIFFVLKKYNPQLKKLNEEIQTNNDSYTSTVNESMKGIREVKTLGIKNNLFTHIEKLISNLFKIRDKQNTVETKFIIVSDIIRNTLESLTFIICAILFFYGQISLTFFIAMTYYVYRYAWIVDNLTEVNKSYQKIIVSIKRINEIVDNKLYKDEQFGEVVLDNCIGNIKFNDVYFGYKDEDLILKDFNLELEPNKKIAIVGKSGQGKSTIFNLITRIFDANKGEILLDNINIKELTEETLRKNVTVVRQEPFIFKGTFKENFEMLKESVTTEEIRKYTKLAYLDDYIMSLPEQYETKIGEGGVNLSGGQKQRLAIARGLLKNSKIILFDEATSALDNESQDYIKKAINTLVENHTIIIIAHRLSTIMDADIIYLINDGKVVAEGTHKELMENSNEYSHLYEIEDI